MNRDLTLFEVTAKPLDKLTLAANAMKAYAQRLIQFERCKLENCTLLVDKVLGGSLDSVLNSVGAPIRIRNAKRAFLQTVAGAASIFPVDILTREQAVRSLQRQTENINPRDLNANIFSYRDTYVNVVQDGWTLSVWPWPTNLYTGQTTTITLDVTQWLPDYSADGDEDFLLKECFDWALYQTAIHANMFLKEEQRVQLNKSYADDLWKTVVDWNTSLVDGNYPVTLD